MDGLLSSVGAIVTLGLAAMAALVGQWAWAGVALALTGALLGFLRYNFPPASIFLGDSGSMLIGLTIGVLGLQSSLKAPTTAALAAPVALLTIPFVDTAAAILRRKLTGRSIFSTDRGHLHHCLLRRGLTHRSALLCVAIFCGLAGAGALASLFLNNELIAILSSATVVATLVATHLFGYGEFLLVKERLRATVAGWLGRPESAPRETEVRLQGSADWPLLWAELTDWACRNQLRAVRLDVNAPALHEGYHARWSRPLEENESCEEWRIVIPLLASGQTVARVEMTGQTTLESFGDKIASLAEITHDLETVVSVLTQEVKSDPPESLPRAPFAWRLKHAEAG